MTQIKRIDHPFYVIILKYIDYKNSILDQQKGMARTLPKLGEMVVAESETA